MVRVSPFLERCHVGVLSVWLWGLQAVPTEGTARDCRARCDFMVAVLQYSSTPFDWASVLAASTTEHSTRLGCHWSSSARARAVAAQVLGSVGDLALPGPAMNL